MTSILERTRRPDVTFYRDGRIDITAHAAIELGLKAGDVIDIARDGMEYYMYVSHKAEEVTGRHEAQVYPTSKCKRVCHNFRAHSVRLCREVLRLNGAKERARLITGKAIETAETGRALPIIIRLKFED